jgi:hypothetical protein
MSLSACSIVKRCRKLQPTLSNQTRYSGAYCCCCCLLSLHRTGWCSTNALIWYLGSATFESRLGFSNIFTELSIGFPKALQMNNRIVPWSSQNNLFSIYVLLIIYDHFPYLIRLNIISESETASLNKLRLHQYKRSAPENMFMKIIKHNLCFSSHLKIIMLQILPFVLDIGKSRLCWCQLLTGSWQLYCFMFIFMPW